MSKTPASRTIWIDAEDPAVVIAIEQRLLPFEYLEVPIRTSSEMTRVIADMVVRGAGCIGVSAGYGMYLASLATSDMGAADADESLRKAAAETSKMPILP